MFQSPQVVGHPCQDLFLRQTFGQGDLDGPVKRQLARVHALQGLDRPLHGEVSS